MIGAEFFAWALETSVAIALLTGLVLLIRKPVSRHIGPMAAYALWLLPVIRVFLPDLALLPALETRETIVANAPAAEFEQTVTVRPGALVPYEDDTRGKIDRTPILSVEPAAPLSARAVVRGNPSAVPALPVLASPVSASPAPAPTPFSTLSPPLLFTATFVFWFGVGSLWLTAMLCRQGLLQRSLLQASRRADPALRQQVAAICADLKIKRPIDVRVCTAQSSQSWSSPPTITRTLVTGPLVTGPLVTGLIRPTIILPAQFDSLYTANEQHMILLHECMHVRRGDLWVTLAALCFRAVNWHNPAIHMGWRPFRTDQEAACDASVLRYLAQTAANQTSGDTQHAAPDQYASEKGSSQGRVVDYGSALIKSARLAADHMTAMRALPAPSLIHQHSSTQVKERLMLIKSSGNRNRGVEAGAALAALTVGLGLTANYTHAAQSTPEPVISNNEPTVATPKTTGPSKGEDQSFSLHIDGNTDTITINGKVIDRAQIEDALAAVGEMDFTAFADRFDDLEFDFDFYIEGIEGAIEEAGDRVAFVIENEVEGLIGDALSDSNVLRMMTGDADQLTLQLGDSAKTSKGKANPFTFSRTNDKTILRIDNSENLRIERDGENLIVNGKSIVLNQCQEDRNKDASLILRVDYGEDGTVQVICQKSSKPLFKVEEKDKRRAVEQSLLIKKRLKAMEKGRDRQAAQEQRRLEQAKERAEEMVARAQERASQMVERAERAVRDAENRQQRAATERQREIERLRRELERLEREENEEPVILAPVPDPAPAAEPVPAPSSEPMPAPAPVPPVPVR
ncbi:MAG: M56 family metallopeptidase [Pseudomonadota bacterium]